MELVIVGAAVFGLFGWAIAKQLNPMLKRLDNIEQRLSQVENRK